MIKFPKIEKLGLSIAEWGDGDKTSVVLAHELESILQSAQVVYGSGFKYTDEFEWSSHQLSSDTVSGLIICIEPLKKKTKAEAALELLSKITNEGFRPPNNADLIVQAKRILEMKDEV